MKPCILPILLSLLLYSCTNITHNLEFNSAARQTSEQGVLDGDWLYGNGLGTTALNLTGTILFPPYGLYVLGNTFLEMKGYEGYYITEILPEKPRKTWENVYDEVRSTPGKIAADLVGQPVNK